MDCISAAKSPNVTRPAWPLAGAFIILAIADGDGMKVIVLSIAICALSQAAIAQTLDCKSIAARKDRLACYDNAAQPTNSTLQPATSKPDSSGYVDPISAEDARMNARLKNICRGC
jgi:hypothetical protein